MPDAALVREIRRKYTTLVGDLDERGRRRWAATEAEAIGRGGILTVAMATGLSDRTIRSGLREIHDLHQLESNRQRRKSGGRKSIDVLQPEVVAAVEALVEPTERGDPQSPLRWTCKSLTNLEAELQLEGLNIGRVTISKILRNLGYSLQGNRKTQEGITHPDRNAQFEHINKRITACRRQHCPAISVDTKKKENLGKMANVGREYRPKGNPIEVDVHDFPSKRT